MLVYNVKMEMEFQLNNNVSNITTKQAGAPPPAPIPAQQVAAFNNLFSPSIYFDIHMLQIA